MKSRKIYYVPGLISAIFIPLLFWYYGNQKLLEPVPNVMDIGIPAKHIHSEKCKRHPAMPRPCHSLLVSGTGCPGCRRSGIRHSCRYADHAAAQR